ncbi:MAG: LPS export ABC transporter periplasmic protein LptC [Candidatus Binatia bacterium]
MRKPLQFGILATVVLLLSGVGFLVARSLWQQHRRDIASRGLEFLPGVSQHIRDFHRVKLQDGRKVWEISAQDAQYFHEDNLVVVREATMELQLKDGRAVGLRGDEARIELAGRDVARVELNGAIQVTASEYVVRTDHAIYDNERRLISVPDPVDISGRGLQARGDTMEVEIDSDIVRLARNVSMHIEPAMLRQGEPHAPL